MTASKTVRSPDGREWHVRSHKTSWLPPWRAVQLHSADRVSEAPFLNRLIGDLVIGALLVPLVIFVFELPIALVRASVSRKAWLEATDNSSPPGRMKWQLEGANAGAAVEEVARQLEGGSQSIQLQNAVFVGAK